MTQRYFQSFAMAAFYHAVGLLSKTFGKPVRVLSAKGRRGPCALAATTGADH